jgi:hypothetical protein
MFIIIYLSIIRDNLSLKLDCLPMWSMPSLNFSPTAKQYGSVNKFIC